MKSPWKRRSAEAESVRYCDGCAQVSTRALRSVRARREVEDAVLRFLATPR